MEDKIRKDMESQVNFDSGYYCSESVLMQVAKENGIDSPLIPAVATGFGAGIARTSGMCGALTGGILALNIVYGRNSEQSSVEKNFEAIQSLISEYGGRCGSTSCSELLGCELGTKEGQLQYGKEELWTQCREYVGIATAITQRLIKERDSE